MSDLITIRSSVLPSSARVVGFRGVEAISRPYEFEIFIAQRYEAGEEPDLADAIGARAVLTISRTASWPEPRVTTMSPEMLARSSSPLAPMWRVLVVRSVCSSRP